MQYKIANRVPRPGQALPQQFAVRHGVEFLTKPAQVPSKQLPELSSRVHTVQYCANRTSGLPIFNPPFRTGSRSERIFSCTHDSGRVSLAQGFVVADYISLTIA